MADEDYTELEIHIHSAAAGSEEYLVEAELSDGSSYRGHFRLGIDTPRAFAPYMDAKDYGSRLFYDLFNGNIRQAYDKAITLAESDANGQLRIRLRIDPEAAELHQHRWEALYYKSGNHEVGLTIDNQTPFSRYLALTIAEGQPVDERPVNVLFAISNPSDLGKEGLAPIAVEEDIRNFVAAVEDLRRVRTIKLSIMPGHSESALSNEVRENVEKLVCQIISGPTSLENILDNLPDCHIFHYLGHGVSTETGATLILEDDAEGSVGESLWMPSTKLVKRLESIDLPKLIFLASCETAKYRPNSTNPFTALAPKLVEAGVPAVIAMQDKVPMDVARDLSRHFYVDLLRHGYVDLALNSARGLLFDSKEADWTIPTLYMRLTSGQLFAEDPVRATLDRIYAMNRQEYMPIPIEVAHMIGNQDLGSLDRLKQTGYPELGILDAIDSIFDETCEIIAAVDGSPADPEESDDTPRAKVALLIGWRGSTKTSQLKSISRYTVRNSLRPDNDQPIIPITLDMRDFPITLAGSQSRLEHMIQQGLESYGLELDEDELVEWLRGEGQATFRILMDSGTDLSAYWRRRGLDAIRKLVYQYPLHQYVLAIDRRFFDARQIEVATNLLIIQPLSTRTVRNYLTNVDNNAGSQLYDVLSHNNLLDLASSPWLLYRMLKQAEAGFLPSSRIEVLSNVVNDMLEPEIPRNSILRQYAEQSLYALAWDMQWNRYRSQKEPAIYEIFSKERRYREYELDALFNSLVSSGILVPVGANMVRFAYSGIQAYCCAKAIMNMDKDKRDQVLDDITASLGRLTRYWWWEETLILLSGLVNDPNNLLRTIDFGMDMLKGEHLFLMARCLMENSPKRIKPELRNQIVGNLILRLHKDNDPKPAGRAMAADLLGQLREESALEELASKVSSHDEDKERWQQELHENDSIVRMQAAFALKEIMPFPGEKIKDPMMYKLLQLWIDEDVEEISRQLRKKNQQSNGARAIAAFALGDLQTESAKNCLYYAFLDRTTDQDTRWAIADALTILDPVEVTQQVILPLLRDKEEPQPKELSADTWEHRHEWRELLAYLVGRIRAMDNVSANFLVECLTEPRDIYEAAQAIESLGLLYVGGGYTELLEQIAIGDEDNPVLAKTCNNEEEKILIRLKSIEALGNIGNHETVEHLQREYTDWDPALKRALYMANEEIDWRLEYGPRR